MSDTTMDHIDLERILGAAVDRGASDVHLKVDRPPVVRFDGELESLPGFPPFLNATQITSGGQKCQRKLSPGSLRRRY